MWNAILGGFVGGCIPAVVAAILSFKQKKQESQMILFGKVFDKKFETHKTIVSEMKAFIDDCHDAPEKIEPGKVFDTLICNWFFLPNPVIIKLTEFCHQTDTSNSCSVCFEVIDLIRKDLQIEILDKKAKENMGLLIEKD